MSFFVGKPIIEECIFELLYSHETVIIPELGAFIKQYRPAGFDYVQGKISPPSTTLLYNDNLLLDDGLLVDKIRIKTGLPLNEVKEHLASYVRICKETLSRKEVVAIPKVGRILKDFEMKNKFISDNHNFNTDTYGLPEISYYPILRNMPQQEERSFTDSVAPIPKPSSSGKTNQVLKIGIPIALAFLIVMTGVWMYTGTKDNLTTENNPTEEPAKLPVNISPTENSDNVTLEDDNIDYTDSESTNEPSSEEYEVVEEDVIEDVATTDENNEEAETEDLVIEETTVSEPVTPAEEMSSDDFRVIYVGLYSKQRGVDVTTAKIVQHDFIPYTITNSKGLTKVGVKVPSGTDAGLLLQQVREKINPKAYLK